MPNTSFSRIASLALLGLFLACAGCCFLADDDADEDIQDGFVMVRGAGKSVTLGTNIASAKATERPEMKVSLDYDFWIQRHEVTCGEFKSLMGLVDCENDSFPVVNVSYYDAVLYANARSKEEHLDTAYTYVDVSRNDDGFCKGIEGLVFHSDVDGYRLPTEAEWGYAARLDWNPSNSVTLDDGLGGPAVICSKGERKICDMEGNVAEWGNDWLGSLRDSAVTDFAGAPDGGSLGQRVLKGGSYRNEAKSISLYSRGDVYAVTSSMRTPYVGFRLARGVIPNALWLSANGLVNKSPVIPLANAFTVRQRLNSDRFKLAFRNQVSGNISFIDYSNSVLSVVEINDTIDSYHPEISPDGRWVAFCTGLEGVSGKSSLYVRELDGDSSVAVKLDVESAAIPRWKILPDGSWAIVYVTDAGDNSDDASFFAKSTWQVSFDNGKFGVPHKLFDGAYHGGVDGSFAVSGSKRLRMRNGESSDIWYNSEQACNASLSKAGDKRTLFLDFGGKTGEEFVGVEYRTHERILISDSTGKLIESIGAPAGFTFDHTEWVSENAVVATLTNSNGAHRKIVLVDVSDSTVTELAEGEELWHPSMWTKNLDVDAGVDLSLDSAGQYYSVDQFTHYLSYKMKLFWKLKDSLEIVGVGNSHMNAGFSARELKNALNMATVPCDLHLSRYLIENYILNHCPRIKYIVVGIDFDLWSVVDIYTTVANQGSALGYKYDFNHDFWKGGLPKGFVPVSQNAPVEYEQFMENFVKFYGQAASIENRGWYDEDGTAEIVEKGWDELSPTPEENFMSLMKIIQTAKNKGVHIIGLIFPISPYYKQTDQYGRHGMLRSTAEIYMRRLQELDEQEEFFVLMDENKMGDHDYDTSMAMDFDHLNLDGSKKLTARLDSLIQTLE